jgi:hypothetical protein
VRRSPFLPNGQRAIVAKAKITGYLLDPHKSGGKDKFFLALGFTSADWHVMAAALRDHAVANPVTGSVSDQWGTRYTVVGPLRTPNRINPRVKSVWQIDHGDTIPRLITAYRA